MARHSKETEKVTSEIDRLRSKFVEQFFGLSDKVFAHIKASLESKVNCPACYFNKEGQLVAGKIKDLEGQCAFCHGDMLVADKQQRNWAVQELSDRGLAPKLKSVEMSLENSDESKLKEDVRALTNEALDEKLKLLGHNSQKAASN